LAHFTQEAVDPAVSGVLMLIFAGVQALEVA
jgi:hypothetical protein